MISAVSFADNPQTLQNQVFVVNNFMFAVFCNLRSKTARCNNGTFPACFLHKPFNKAVNHKGVAQHNAGTGAVGGVGAYSFFGGR